MFEDKRFKNDNDNSSNHFFMPDNNTGLRDGNDNLNFGEQPVYQKKNKPKKDKSFNKKVILKFLIIILVLGLLVGGSFLAYKKIFDNPYSVYKNVINYGYDYLNAKINDFKNKSLDYDKDRDILSSSGNLSINSNLLEQLKGYEFKYKLVTDLNKEMIDSNWVINKDNKSVLNLDVFLRDKGVILNSKDIYDKYLQVKSNQEIPFNKVDFNYNILNDILRVIKDTILKDLNKEKMSTKKISIKIQNKNVSVFSNNYVLENDDLKKIYQDVMNALINDNDIVENLADLFNLRKAEIKEVFENLKNNEKILSSFKKLEFNVFTKGITRKIVGGKILFNNKEIISYTDYKNILNINTGTTNDKIDILKSNNETKLSYFKDNSNLLTIESTKKEDKTNYEFNIEIEKLEVEGNLELEIKRVANKRVTSNIILDVKGKNDKDDFNIYVEFNNNLQVGGTIQSIPKNNITLYESLNNNEKKEIENRFNNLLDKLPIKDFIKDNNDVNYCEISSNCECLGSICTCYYLDSFGVEQSINCLNRDMVTE